MKKTVCLCAAVLVLLCLCGCSLNIFDSADIMRPPGITGSGVGIRECIEKAAGSDYVLKYPKNGSFRSAVITHDSGSDGGRVCAALFKSEMSGGINVLLLSENGDTWETDAQFSENCSEVDRVEFCDLNGDGTDDIVIGWSNYGMTPHRITAYVKINGEYKNLSVEQPYSEMCCGRFTDNKFDSVILLTLADTDNKAAASLITMNDQRSDLKAASSAQMNGSVTGYDGITYGYINKSKYGLVVDGHLSDGNTLTQVVCCEGKVTVSLPLEQSGELVREYPIGSHDINHDGIVDIPTVGNLLTEEGEEPSDETALIVWNDVNIDKSRLEPKDYTVLNSTGGYLYRVDEGFAESCTVQADGEGGCAFYKWNGTAFVPTKGELLFEIKRFSEQEWQSASNGGEYEEIIHDSGLYYAVKCSAGSGITIDEVRKNFIIIDW